MTADPRIDEAKQLLDAINADDVAEDAAFQTQIDSLSSNLSTITAERDALQTQVDALLAEKASTIADLVVARDSLDARITALGG